MASGIPAWEAAAGGGALLDLSDTPSSYSGEGGSVLAVNSGATAVEFTDEITISKATFGSEFRWEHNSGNSSLDLVVVV